MATKLHDESLFPGDCVYDICYGPGKVQSACNGKILVTFGGRGRPRQYNENGVTGKNCSKTLYHRPPAVIPFPKEETRAAKLQCALIDVLKIFNFLIEDTCPTTCCDEPQHPCEQWQSTQKNH